MSELTRFQAYRRYYKARLKSKAYRLWPIRKVRDRQQLKRRIASDRKYLITAFALLDADVRNLPSELKASATHDWVRFAANGVPELRERLDR